MITISIKIVILDGIHECASENNGICLCCKNTGYFISVDGTECKSYCNWTQST